MIAVVLVIIMQATPLLLLLYWGVANRKISEYYLWLRAVLLCKLRGTNRSKEVKAKKEPPDRIVPRRPSLELRLENLNNKADQA